MGLAFKSGNNLLLTVKEPVTRSPISCTSLKDYNLHLEGREEPLAVVKPSIDVEGEHPRVAKLLPLRQLVLRVAGKAWTP